MLVVLKFPYAIKKDRREYLIEKYTRLLREGDCVLISDPIIQVEVHDYNSDKDLIVIVEDYDEGA